MSLNNEIYKETKQFQKKWEYIAQKSEEELLGEGFLEEVIKAWQNSTMIPVFLLLPGVQHLLILFFMRGYLVMEEVILMHFFGQLFSLKMMLLLSPLVQMSEKLLSQIIIHYNTQVELFQEMFHKKL